VTGSPVRRECLGGRRWRRHEIDRFTIRDLRAGFSAAEFAHLAAVDITVGGHRATVSLTDEPCGTAFGGHRRYLRCPRCGGRANTLGAHPEFGLGCARRSCVGGWRGRAHGVSAMTVLVTEGVSCSG
jgi:hypothetical protein